MALRFLFYFLIFLSGGSALVYEVVWTRQLTLVFGVSIHAVSAVLTAFMLGLAAGSRYWGRRSPTLVHPLRAYALLEAGIGLYALAFPLLHRGLRQIYFGLPLDHIPAELTLTIRFFCAVGLLLLPTLLMGGTLPLLGQAFREDWPRTGRTTSMLYGLNTLGAALGAAIAGFSLLPHFGMRTSNRIAVAVNLGIALTALLAARPTVTAGESDASAPPAAEPSRESDAVFRRFLWLVAATAGLCGLGFEIVWTKILVLVLGNSTWAFSTTLAAYLFSLALGSLAAAPFIDRLRNRRRTLGLLLSTLAALGALSLFAFHMLIKKIAITGAAGLFALVAGQFVLSFVIMLPAALISGMLFPLTVKLAVPQAQQSGRGFGDMLAANTVGAVVGSVAIGTVALQWLGIQKTLLVLCLLAAGLATVFLHRYAESWGKTLRLGSAGLAVLFWLSLILRTPTLTQAPPGYDFLYYKEGTIGTLAVYEAPESSLKIFDINNITEVATDSLSLSTFRLMALFPAVLQEQPRSALVVTFGAGIVAGHLAELPLEIIECAEINPDAAEVGRIFRAENHEVLRRGRVQLIIEDGRNFLQSRRRQYDIITADATHPTGADSWLLYTKEYYTACRQHLTSDGIFLQWLPLHALSPEGYRTIVRTAQAAFPHVSLWFSGYAGGIGHTLLVAAKRPIRPDRTVLQRRLRQPALRRVLALDSLADADALASLFLASDQSLRSMLSAEPTINTDDLPFTGFPRTLPRPDFAPKMLSTLLSLPPPVAFHAKEDTGRALFSAIRRIKEAWRTAFQGRPLQAAQQLLAFNFPAALPRPYRFLAQDLAERLFYAARGRKSALPESSRRLLLTAATRLQVRRPGAYIELAAILRREGRWDEAERLLRRGAQTAPSGELYFHLGLLLQEGGQLEAARTAYESGLRWAPRSGRLCTNLGLVYARLQMWKKAEAMWRRALRINPADSMAHRNLQRLMRMRLQGK